MFAQFLSDFCGLDLSNPILVSTAGGCARLKICSHIWRFAIFDGVLPHGPEEVVEAFRSRYLSGGHDAVIAVGGGSVLGMGKIMAAEEQARFVAVPTTLSGSEMTPIFGRKIGREKVTKTDPQCQPELIIYDPLISVDLPDRVLSASAMNSLAHSVEAVFIRKTPDTPELAQVAISALMDGVPAVMARSDAVKSRLRVQYGGFLGGLLIQKNGIALHHELCHVIGGVFGIDHGISNSAVLAHVVAYNMVGEDPFLQEYFFRLWGDESPAHKFISLPNLFRRRWLWGIMASHARKCPGLLTSCWPKGLQIRLVLWSAGLCRTCWDALLQDSRPLNRHRAG